jgi:hypothetical protein
MVLCSCLQGCAEGKSSAYQDGGFTDSTTDGYAGDIWHDLVTDLGSSDAVVVDTSAQDTGSKDGSVTDFTVDQQIDQFLPPDAAIGPSGSCAQAPLVSVGSGKTTLAGDTSQFADEFSGLTCSASVAGMTLPGPQAYFRIAAQKDQWYKIVIAPSFDAYIYIFTSSTCSAAAIEADCQSIGTTGLSSRGISSGSKQALYFKAPTASGFYVAVDSIATWFEGPFELTIEPISKPGNATCATAAPLIFSSMVAQVTGDTGITLTPDETPNPTCDNDTLIGPQVYYTFSAQAGATYTIELITDTAQYLHPLVVAHSCSVTSISGDCSSGGVTGDYISASHGSGETITMSYNPSQPGLQLIGVDSIQPFNYGGFTLRVTQSP